MKPRLIETSLENCERTFKLAGVPAGDFLSSCYLSYFLELMRAKGTRTTVRHLKEVYTEILRFSCGLKLEVCTTMWLKRDKDGFPIKLSPFKKVLRQGSVLERRKALSILRVFESLTLPPVPNLETVTSPSKGKDFYAQQLKTPFESFLSNSRWGKWIGEIFEEARTDVLYVENEGMPFHFSTKRGVEGPTCLTAGRQSLAINETVADLLERFDSFFREGNWRELLTENQWYFKNRKDVYPTTGKAETFLGRLTFISDKGGKTRLVAIGNYWIQDVLRNLHRVLYKTLRMLPTDGTYDQIKQSDRVKEQSRIGWCWSYDLSSATDRFPIQPQSDVLKHLNPEIGDLWTKILESMTFEYKGQTITYAVGQPMGLYSSWATFSLTHHAIIQYCAYVVRAKYPFTEYSILGDDVAIWNKAVAMKYKEIISGLDVVINYNKSFEPNNENLNEPGIAEFAKRIFVKGTEITPLSPGILNESWKSFYALPELMKYLGDHDILVNGTPVSRLFKMLKLSPKHLEELFCLFRIKECIDAPVKGLIFDVPSPEFFEKITVETVTIARAEKLAEQTRELWKTVVEISLIFNDPTGQALENCFDGPIPHTLYLRKIVDTRLFEIFRLEEKLSSFTQSVQESDSLEGIKIPSLHEIEYLPSVDIGSILVSLSGKPKRHRVYRGKYIQQLLAQIRKK